MHIFLYDKTQVLFILLEFTLIGMMNVTVQREGQANFNVWDKVREIYQKSTNMKILGLPIIEKVMNPRDAICIPRYCLHLAVSMLPRLSISFCQGSRGPLQDRT